jgi:PAS domain S-box-containing protein
MAPGLRFWLAWVRWKFSCVALAAQRSGGQKTPSQGEGSEPRYWSIFENAGDGLIIHDIETGQVVEINQAACTMYSGMAEALLGQPFSKFVHPENFHQFEKFIQTVQSEGFSIAQQVHLRQDGSPFYVEISSTVLTNQGQAIIILITYC